jgi:putative ATPase
MSLFAKLEPDDAAAASRPLAERMRPRTLEEFAGQQELLGPGKPLRVAIEHDDLGSMILWGPPGCGKTTLARLIARRTHSEFIAFSAVLSGIREIKDVMAAAGHAHRAGRRTIVFVDEVHRFNKAQQDAFLPHVEAGTITLIGATTENPSFEVIAPLLSRTRVYTLQALTSDEITGLLRRALADDERGLGREKIEVAAGILERIAIFADGDARAAYNTLEALVRAAPPVPGGRAAAPPDGRPATHAAGRRVLTEDLLSAALQRKFLQYDKAGEEHYNLISALHKSVRNSDADAALYWLARMLESGEAPLYVARRLVRMASEDIGLADPAALGVAVAAMQAADFIGVPEGHLALAQAAVYLALAPKSNALYTGYNEVESDLQNKSAEPVPLHLRNAVTPLMKHQGYGRGYQYDHNVPDKVADMTCLPDNLADRRYYQPTDQGFEKRLRARMAEILRIRAGVNGGENDRRDKEQEEQEDTADD